MTYQQIDADIKIQLIKEQPVFSKLSENMLYELAELFTVQVFTSNETIVKEGEPVDSIYIIVSGTAEIRHEFVENGELKYKTITTLTPNQAIGLNEAGFYSLSGFRTATAIALTDMVTLELSVARFHGFTLANPHVNKEMKNYAENILHFKM